MATEKQEPQIIWHYTNWAGLDGILASKKLWTSHIAFLNDAQELMHAAEVFDGVIDEFAEAREYLGPTPARAIVDRDPELEVFVASFSEDGDDLSQWRGYATPAPGFALGFDRAKLQYVVNASRYKLARCIYEPKVQREKFQQILGEYLRKCAAQPKDEKFKKRLSGLRADLFGKFSRIAPEYKNHKFSAEREWRLISESITWVQLRSETPGFHPSKSLVVPHCEVPIVSEKANALEFVRIGPNAHDVLMLQSISILLQSRGFGNTRVLNSDIPFRNW